MTHDAAAYSPTWTAVPIDTDSTLSGVSCAADALCVTYDQAGAVFASSDPGNPAGSWPAVYTGSAPISGLACPSISLCVAADGAGAIVTSRSPSRAGTWTSRQVDGNVLGYCEKYHSGNCQTPFTGLSCGSPATCVAIDQDGYAYSSTDPAGGSWNTQAIDPNGYGAYESALVTLSCPSASLCVAADNYAGNFLTTQDPTSEPASWTFASTEYVISGVWCPLTDLCVASATSPAEVSTMLVSTDPTAGASSWRPINLGLAGVSGAACAEPSVCLVVYGNQVALGRPLPSRASLRRGLPAELARAAHLRVQRRSSLLMSAPCAGRLTIGWYAGTRRVAGGSVTFANAGAVRLTLRLARGGRRALATAGRWVVARARFTPAGVRWSASASRRFRVL